MRRLLLAALLLAPVPAFAQSSPNLIAGRPLPAATLNSFFAAKLDASRLGASGGVAPLDSGLLVPIANLPVGTTSSTLAIGTLSVTATGGTAPRSLADRAADIFNVVDYGAKCDDTTDDSTAINAAFSAARAVSVSEINQPFSVVFPPNRRCLIKSTINATGFIYTGSIVTGGFIHCAVTGGVCIDALSSRFINWDKLTIYGDPSLTPTIGIQIGRVSGASADFFTFNQVKITGYYAPNSGTQAVPFGACIYDYAAENVTFNSLYCYNRSSVAGSYGVVGDGYNHFNALSGFVTQTNPLNTRMSFLANSFFNGQILASNNPAMWVGGSRQWETHGTYLANVATGSPSNVVTLYTEDSQGESDSLFDSHMETGAATDEFLLSGTYATPILEGFKYDEPLMNPSHSIFRLDTGVTSASMSGAEIHVTEMPGGGPQVLFDNPAVWTLSGSVYLPAVDNWSEPAGFTGRLCFAAPNSCTMYVPTPALNRNPDFQVDQVNAGAGTRPSGGNGLIIVDGWRTRVSGSFSNVAQFQQTTTAPPPGYSYSLSTNVPSAVTTTVNHYGMRSNIEGIDWAQMSFGNSNAQSFSFDYCAKSSVVPYVVSAFAQNNGASRSYVLNNTVSTANTWQCFHNVVPGDTGGSWTVTKNTVGLAFGFDFIPSTSTYVTTPGTWQSGEFYDTSTSSNLGAAGGQTLNITGIHIRPTQFYLPYQPRTFQQELSVDQHWYVKSFPQAIAPAQSGGTAGATTMVSPYAFTTGLTVGGAVGFPEVLYANNNTGFPTITFYSTSTATADCYDSTKAANAGAGAAVNTGDAGFMLSCPLVSGDAAGDQLQAQWSADSGF